MGDALSREMRALGVAARDAAAVMARASSQAKDLALRRAAARLRSQRRLILEANAEDSSRAREWGASPAALERLELTPERIRAMADGLERVAELPDPVGRRLAAWTRPNGLEIERVSVPLGVIGIIYESRPNVTADAGGLCLKAGNASLLRGGSESFQSSGAILECLREGLKAAGLPLSAIQRVPTRERAAVGLMLSMSEFLDVIVPRGSRSLIQRVEREARVPVLAHLDGVCHTYVDGGADLSRARAIVLNAKMRRPGVCGATETLLIDRRVLSTHLGPIVSDLLEAGCEVRGDAEVCARCAGVIPAEEADWDAEYLAPILSVRVVDGVAGAIRHVRRHGSGHTEAIVTEEPRARERFEREVDSAIVMVNASTQFADGGEFGMGAEIGIATGKLHARGPVGSEQLTSYKYLVRGQGQVRP